MIKLPLIRLSSLIYFCAVILVLVIAVLFLKEPVTQMIDTIKKK